MATAPVTGKPLIESDCVEGTTVYEPAGNNTGSIKRLMIEKLSGRVAYHRCSRNPQQQFLRLNNEDGKAWNEPSLSPPPLPPLLNKKTPAEPKAYPVHQLAEELPRGPLARRGGRKSATSLRHRCAYRFPIEAGGRRRPPWDYLPRCSKLAKQNQDQHDN